MKRLMTLGVGTWLVLVLLATIMASTPAITDARVVSEAEAISSGFDCADVTQIPQSECEALVSFYYATGGGSGGGWLVTNTPCDWDGITCEAGHVTGLQRGYLVGSIPPEVADLSHLTLLELVGSGLSGVIPPELGMLSQLETFSLRHNYEVGIPPELGNLTNLQTLEITAASVPAEPGDQPSRGDATLPPELGNLTNLQSLVITYSIGGTIPPELGNLSNLQVLNLESNFSLSGSIPPELGQLSNLTYLNLSFGGHNCLSVPPWQGPLGGPLPPELGNLANLQVLNLYCQSFSGPIPMTFINLLDLELFVFQTVGEHYLCEPPDQAFQDWIDAIPQVYSTGILCEPSSQQLYLPLVAR